MGSPLQGAKGCWPFSGQRLISEGDTLRPDVLLFSPSGIRHFSQFLGIRKGPCNQIVYTLGPMYLYRDRVL